MKTRIISGIIGTLLLVGVVFSGKVFFSLAVTVLAVIGLSEFYIALRISGYNPVKTIGYIAALSLVFIGLNGQFHFVEPLLLYNLFSFATFIFGVILFSMMIFTNNSVNIIDAAVTFFGIFYIVFLFSFLLQTYNLENGQFFVWLIFIGAFSTDTFAYFTGRLIGKTKKFIPAIVPTKTLEGCFGGAIGCGVALFLFGLFINRHVSGIPLYHYILMGIICGTLSQIGDWAASAIKRFAKIKDYGRIMPGHGGVLDRFDSILFSAPVIYFYLIFFII